MAYKAIIYGRYVRNDSWRQLEAPDYNGLLKMLERAGKRTGDPLRVVIWRQLDSYLSHQLG